METEVKEYYKNYEASNEINRAHYFLADQILGFNPTSVFEFGCGTGKNLKLLLDQSPKIRKATGVDISMKNIEKAHTVNFLNDCRLADERSLATFEDKSCDVVFTCSVLDHIQQISRIIVELLVYRFGELTDSNLPLVEDKTKSDLP